MSSIYDLDTDVKQLSSSNDATTKMEYQQVTSTRDVVGTNFSNGTINFKFSNSGVRRWIPSKSYVRLRLELTKGDGAALDTAFGAAPNMGLCSNLFQSGEFRINDKVVSRVGDFISQVDALETRLTKSRSWLQSIGESTNWWSEDHKLRLAEVSSDGSIIKGITGVSDAVTSTRTAMGFDAPGADNNGWAYNAASGALIYTRGANATGLNAVGASAVFPVGSFFKFVGVANTPEVEMKVLSNDGAGALVIEPLLNANVALNPANNFARVVRTLTAPNSRRVGAFELIWQPPLSIFKVEKALPCGNYELVLNPQTYQTFQKRAIESLLGAVSIDSAPKTGGLATQIRANVVDMYLQCAMVDGPRVDDITYLLDLEQTRCQSDKINNASFGQKNFDVSPSTYALTLAYQDARAGEHTAISPAKFRSYEVGNTPLTAQELALNRMFINYAGQNMPAPDADPEFVAGTDYTTQRYVESQLASGGYHDTGGVETITEYHDRGAYYHFRIPRDATDRSTRVSCHQGFTATTDVTNMRVLLFDHSKQVCMVRIQDGRVVSVELEDA